MVNHRVISMGLLGITGLRALNNGLARSPPLGWRPWNCYLGDVYSERLRDVIDAVVDRSRAVNGVPTSLADLGFGDVGVDDGWQACGTGPHGSFHADNGSLLVNFTRFPGGFKPLVDYAHERGVKMTFYVTNCICMDEYIIQGVGVPGGVDPAWAERCYTGDIALARASGFDNIMIDNCGDDWGRGYVSRMQHIATSGPSMVVENSNQANGVGPPRGLPNDPSGWCNFNTFRTDGDLFANFGQVLASALTVTRFQNLTNPISRPGCWAYPDMLQVGNFGGPLNLAESRSHFGIWAIISSPLFLSFDLRDRSLVNSLWEIVTNTEVIAVNQGWFGHPGRLIIDDEQHQVWAKLQEAGSEAVLVVNKGSATASFTVTLTQLGLPASVAARDLWAHKNLGVIGTSINLTLGAHESAFYMLHPPPVGQYRDDTSRKR